MQLGCCALNQNHQVSDQPVTPSVQELSLPLTFLSPLIVFGNYLPER
jgi:hypothetical protein